MPPPLTIRVSPLAERDLEAIGDYIARDSAKTALNFIIASTPAPTAGVNEGILGLYHWRGSPAI